MSSTLTKILVHIVYSTKNREESILREIEPALFAYTGGICRRLDSPLIAMGAAADHVHLLVGLSKNLALSGLLLEVKRDTSKWMKEQSRSLVHFGWQDGYFGFSVDEQSISGLRSYFAGQREHHQRQSFQDEVRALLRRHGLEFDERYIWD